MDNNQIHWHLSLKLFTEEKAFGPGIARLLELADEYHSLNKAAQSMGMAYSKAWKILNNAENALEVRLLDRHAGGSMGGGAELTEEGRDLLNRYRGFERETKEAAEVLFNKYFG